MKTQSNHEKTSDKPKSEDHFKNYLTSSLLKSQGSATQSKILKLPNWAKEMWPLNATHDLRFPVFIMEILGTICEIWIKTVDYIVVWIV